VRDASGATRPLTATSWSTPLSRRTSSASPKASLVAFSRWAPRSVARTEVFEAFVGEDRPSSHGHSYTANPLTCAAARASLSLLGQTCTARRQMIELVQRGGLQRLAGFPASRALRRPLPPRVRRDRRPRAYDTPPGGLEPSDDLRWYPWISRQAGLEPGSADHHRPRSDSSLPLNGCLATPPPSRRPNPDG
jgi:hypothetical protein